ncbi:MAG: S26 family signal peptidase [Candidatus Thermoplasmatota archaeon]|nr:S26 family signal peptidase [Candidatus Thermoplasmatota archaeon]
MNEKILLTIRDVLAAVAIVGIIITALWAYTGQFPDTPMVVVTSGSMMHDNAPYGKIGTIDPGDLVLVKKISSRDGITVRGESSNPATGHRTYSDYGDVIIYYPMGNRDRTPIIHRAICWVEYKGGKYTVREYGIEDASVISIPELHISGYKPMNSGFITKGDNNELPDQYPSGGICAQPVKPEWIIGKARGELPWFGMIKLMIAGNQEVNAENGWVKVGKAVAPKDIWVCLGLSLVAISAIPISLDAYEYYRKKKDSESL